MTPNLNLVNQVLRSARTVAAPRLARLPAGKFGAVPIAKLGTVANAGLFGASADLPGEPGGEIEPPVLDQNPGGPINGSTEGRRIPSWGGRGPWAVESGNVEVNAGEHGNPFTGETVLAEPFESWLGGGIVGTDPNTGKPIYDPLGYGNFGREYAGGAQGFGGLGSGYGGPGGGFTYGIGGQGFGGVGNNSAGIDLAALLPGKDREKIYKQS